MGSVAAKALTITQLTRDNPTPQAAEAVREDPAKVLSLQLSPVPVASEKIPQ
jgi:hypothetical protein